MNDVRNRAAAGLRTPSNSVDGQRGNPHAVQELHAYRRPIDGQLLQIVQSVMREFLPQPPADSTTLEIACGDGQLRSWTPRALRKLIIHTDLSNTLLQQFQSRYPEARVQQADARAAVQRWQPGCGVWAVRLRFASRAGAHPG